MAKRSISRLRFPHRSTFASAWSVFETQSDSCGGAASGQEISGPASASTDRSPADTTLASMLDVALALVLNEIVHQARSITTATGAAVLLVREGVPVHCSISGATARDASAYLSECLGLADSFWREGASQCCHDVEADPRFDSASCRSLGIRSFMIVPVRDKGKSLVAIVQTFSPRPQAFSARDLLALQGLGQRVADHVQLAERSLTTAAKVTEKANTEISPGSITTGGFAPRLNPWKRATSHERRSLVLGLMIIGLSIFLGWTLGRSERQSPRRNAGATRPPVVNYSQIAVTSAEPNITGNQSAESGGALSDGAQPSVEDEQSQPKSESRTHHVRPRPSPVSKLMHSDASSHDLVIFENGRQVFPVESPQPQPVSDVPAKSEEQTKLGSKDGKTPVSVSQNVAEEHLLNRIEPDYPEYARERRLQGTVILNVNVGQDGAVHSLSRVSGDPQLALLAAKAVRQWKFAPLVRDGVAVSFETQVALNFALP
ncbi:MAG TPA: TonB family protein [Candidatus Acidoferrales bacterium]|nr:TonB family protein [Candidatus Acidoferrales bacterium]